VSHVGVSTGETANDRGRSEMPRKTVRFDEATVEHVDELVERDEYASFSAAIRDQLPDDWPPKGGRAER